MKINRRSAVSSIKITSALVLALSIMAGGCMAREMTVSVVVFNYTSRPLGEVAIQGHYIGGFYQKYLDGTGGKIYCCIDVKPGQATVAWEIGWPVDDPIPEGGLSRSAIGVIPKPTGHNKYLGVHIYPDERVEFTLTRDIPPEKKEGEP